MTTEPTSTDTDPDATSAGGQSPDDQSQDDQSQDELPSLSVQVSQQLGGVHGLVESAIPVIVFVVLNFVGSKTDLWSLRISLIASVGFALAVAAFRLRRKETVRHSLNGVFGIALGALIAARSGEARDFYLPGIWISVGYTVALIVSVAARRPLVGWLWAVMLDGGETRWYRNRNLLRAFDRLTALWVLIYVLKVGVQYWLWRAHQDDLLGLARIFFGWPPYALLLALTVWSARRVLQREAEQSDQADGQPGQPAAGQPAEASEVVD